MTKAQPQPLNPEYISQLHFPTHIKYLPRNMSLSTLLPPAEGGWLSYWMLLFSSLAVFNTVANYLSFPAPFFGTVQIYPKAQVTTLQGRTFGTWTIISAVVRLQLAYDPSNMQLYGLSMFTFAVASFHFGCEYFLFRTMSTKSLLQSGFTWDSLTAVFMAIGWVRA